jgi:hypothetical protein
MSFPPICTATFAVAVYPLHKITTFQVKKCRASRTRFWEASSCPEHLLLYMLLRIMCHCSLGAPFHWVPTQLRQRPLSNPSDFHHFLVNHQRPPAADVELQVEMQEALVSLVGIKLDLAEAVP